MSVMASPSYYREQAHRCLLLSRSTVDPKARMWLTDMASYYAEKARWANENGAALMAPCDGVSVLLPQGRSLPSPNALS